MNKLFYTLLFCCILKMVSAQGEKELNPENFSITYPAKWKFEISKIKNPLIFNFYKVNAKLPSVVVTVSQYKFPERFIESYPVQYGEYPRPDDYPIIRSTSIEDSSGAIAIAIAIAIPIIEKDSLEYWNRISIKTSTDENGSFQEAEHFTLQNGVKRYRYLRTYTKGNIRYTLTFIAPEKKYYDIFEEISPMFDSFLIKN